MLMSIGQRHSGFTLIEVLVTFLIVAIGLPGLGALQVNTMNNSFETYQRALVGSIVEDMAARIRMNANAALAGEYFVDLESVAASLNCVGTVSQRDLCEWKAQIMGCNAQTGVESGDELICVPERAAQNVGAPLAARGCIERLGSSGSGELWLRVSVAWIGLTPQAETALGCGADDMGNEAYRRVVFRDVAVR